MLVQFVSDDPVSEIIDQRILVQARIIRDLGHEVLIQGGRGPCAVIVDGFVVNPRVPCQASLQGFREWLQGGASLPRDPTDRSSSVRNSRLFLLAKRMPRFLHPLLKRAYGSWRVWAQVMAESGRVWSTASWINASEEIAVSLGRRQADLYVACDLPAAIAMIYLRNDDGRVVWFDAHEIWSEQAWLDGLSDSDTTTRLEDICVRESDFFSSVHSRAVDYFVEKAGRLKSYGVATFHIPNTASLPVIRPMMRRTPHTSLNLVFHGGLSSARGTSRFLSLLQQIEDINWTLTFVGWGAESDLIRLAKDSRVRLLEPLPTMEIHSYLLNFDAVVLPYIVSDLNTRWAQPNKFCDAYLAGVPILYNSELEVVDAYAREANIGASFNYPLDSSARELQRASMSLSLAMHKLLDFEVDWSPLTSELSLEQAYAQVKLLCSLVESKSPQIK